MADLRIQFTEQMVGANHPTREDTLNRLSLVEHNIDGTHKYKGELDLREFLPVGFVTDGSIDYTTEINLALATGSPCYVPEGTWLITQLVVPTGGSLRGAGRTKTIFKCDAAHDDYAIIVQGGGTTGTSFVRGYMGDFAINGQKGTTALGGILLDWAYIWTLERIYVYDFFHADAVGLHAKDAFNINFQSCQANMGDVGNPKATGFKISSIVSGQNVTQITLFDCLSQLNTTAIAIDCNTGADGIVIEQCGIGSNTTGIDIQAGTLYGLTIKSNHIESSTTGIQGVATLIGVDIEDNYFWNVDTAISLNGADCINIDLNTFNGSAGARTTLSATNCTNVQWGTNKTFSSAYSGRSLTNTPLVFTVKDRSEYSLTANASAPVLISSRDYYVFENTGTTNVGNFSGAVAGQTVQFRINDNYTRVYNSANIKLREGGQVYGSGCTLTLYTPDGATFYEIARAMPREAVAPTDGTSIYQYATHSAGDTRYHSAPAAGGTMGWVCTTSGSPGTWKTFGAVSA